MSTTSRYRTAILALAVAAGFQLIVDAQDVEKKDRADRIERKFQRGGKITMDLSAGAYSIRGGSVDSIRVRWDTKDPRDMSSVRTDVTVNGTNAIVRMRGPKNNFRVDMDVPAIADIHIDLSAGDLSFKGVEGNKSVSMWAGEVEMEVGDPQLYRSVDITVRAGEINAGPFGGARGGLFRSYRWDGSGKYAIVAKLTAGEIRLVK
jgi:hypothetical protein